jgi:hypothetical protein
LSATVNDGDTTCLPRTCFHAHVEASCDPGQRPAIA